MRSFMSLCLLSLLMASPTLTHAEDLPKRAAPPPQTTNSVPHIQINVESVPELTKILVEHVAQFPGVNLGPTRISMPGGIGFQLEDDVPLARPDVIVGGREFAHLHPDGSLHASLDPVMAFSAIDAGWAVAHPWAEQRAGWEGFVMIFTPKTREDLEVIIRLIDSSYHFVTGRNSSD